MAFTEAGYENYVGRESIVGKARPQRSQLKGARRKVQCGRKNAKKVQPMRNQSIPTPLLKQIKKTIDRSVLRNRSQGGGFL